MAYTFSSKLSIYFGGGARTRLRFGLVAEHAVVNNMYRLALRQNVQQ